jgi:ubiquitin-like protein Pup
MVQQQVSKQKSPARDTRVEDSNSDASNPELAEQTDRVIDDIDDVLDEQLDTELLDAMDEVLEENAEEFVAQYIQKGGE